MNDYSKSGAVFLFSTAMIFWVVLLTYLDKMERTLAEEREATRNMILDLLPKKETTE